MAKPKLILVHGMGQHTADSFKGDFNNACIKAFNLYPGYSGKSAEDYVEIISVGYNDIFDKQREKMAQRSNPVLERLKAIPDMTDNLASDIVTEVTEIENNIADDEFFKTHWLDVIFYRFTTLGENVRIRLAKAITDAIGTVNGGSSNVHVIGHSLGTAVVHDTLAKLYQDKYTIGDKNLDVVMHKMGSLHLIANTSRLLESFVDIDNSVVKPGPDGCTARYNEYRHTLDPITWSKSFDPTDNGDWISNDSWHFKRYQLHRLTSVTSKHGNTHSINHYLFNPKTHLEIFKRVFGLTLTEEQIQEGHENYINQTLKEVARDLERSLSELKTLNLENVSGLILSAKKLLLFIQDLGGQYEI